MGTRTWLVGSILATLTITAFGCISSEKKETAANESQSEGFIERDVAAPSVADEPALIIYRAFGIRRDSMGNEIPSNIKVDVWTPLRWSRADKQASTWRQILLESYFANTRVKSDRRSVACFTGSASDVERAFFTVHEPEKVRALRISKSSEEMMMGLEFEIFYNGQWSRQHFRMTNCLNAGKNAFLDPAVLIGELRTQKGRDAQRRPQNVDKGEEFHSLLKESDVSAMLSRRPAGAQDEGYVTNDSLSGPGPSQGIPRFRLKGDFDRAAQAPREWPWREAKVNLSNEADAIRLAMIMKYYAYDGMGNQNLYDRSGQLRPQPAPNNMNLRAEESPRYWCHMPWLNQGPTGREAVHGLTQERDLAPSAMYPQAAPGSDWGVAVFNWAACQAIDRVFGPASNPRVPPKTPAEWQAKTNSDDGTVIAKFLFTTANFPAIKNAWQLHANVSEPKSTTRALSPVRHIQLDIGLKDSGFRGASAGADHWLMFTYYYDEKYNEAEDLDPQLIDFISKMSPYRKASRGRGPAAGFPRLPEGIRKMRPVGIQWGFTPQESRIFTRRGAITNNKLGLLNGPADNPASSCLGCHGTAGTKARMSPGITSSAQYQSEKSKRLTLDFGQQFAFARKNYETRPQTQKP